MEWVKAGSATGRGFSREARSFVNSMRLQSSAGHVSGDFKGVLHQRRVTKSVARQLTQRHWMTSARMGAERSVTFVWETHNCPALPLNMIISLVRMWLNALGSLWYPPPPPPLLPPPQTHTHTHYGAQRKKDMKTWRHSQRRYPADVLSSWYAVLLYLNDERRDAL